MQQGKVTRTRLGEIKLNETYFIEVVYVENAKCLFVMLMKNNRPVRKMIGDIEAIARMIEHVIAHGLLNSKK